VYCRTTSSPRRNAALGQGQDLRCVGSKITPPLVHSRSPKCESVPKECTLPAMVPRLPGEASLEEERKSEALLAATGTCDREPLEAHSLHKSPTNAASPMPPLTPPLADYETKSVHILPHGLGACGSPVLQPFTERTQPKQGKENMVHWHSSCKQLKDLVLAAD
jgi:hypothetical protein